MGVNRRKIRSQHQELNFRVQNLDENRQFLFKQTTDYEQKLTNQAQKQKKLLMTIDKLRTQFNDVQNIKLRSISLNLKGATELKEGTLSKIPRLEESRMELQKLLSAKTKKHEEYTNVIEELSQKRDSLRKHLIDTQKQHEQLSNEQKEQIKLFEKQRKKNEFNNELIEVNMNEVDEDEVEMQSMPNNDDMTTIFDNTDSDKKEEEKKEEKY